MSIWRDRPNRETRDATYSILRVPAKTIVRGTVLSPELVGTELHYFRRRSRPCTGNTCDACKSGQPPRWYGFVFLLVDKLNIIQILEFTPRCFDAFDLYYTERGTLRGAHLSIHRMNERTNGPLVVKFDDVNLDRPSLPTPDDLRGVLMRMWEVNDNADTKERGSVYDATLHPASNGKERLPK